MEEKGYFISIYLVVSILVGILTFGIANAKSGSIDHVVALQKGDFKKAHQLAKKMLSEDDTDSQANLTEAIILYKQISHNLTKDFTVFFRSLERGINKRFFRFFLTDTEKELEKVENHLRKVAADIDITLRLNMSEWKVDWNNNGRLDRRDRLLFQIEYDADGKAIPDDDPRRRPTFRFDIGDIYWARAMIAFQRSMISVVLAYTFPDDTIAELEEKLFRSQSSDRRLILKMTHPEYVKHARSLILRGLTFADEARKEYLLETDDEGEWLPNPNQKNHPLPLPVDEKLYQTWQDIIQDITQLIEGKTGLSVAELVQLGDHRWKKPPRGFINVGELLRNPGDIILDFAHLENLDRSGRKKNRGVAIEKVLTDILGSKFVKQMPGSKLISRLERMKKEVSRGTESFDRKLRYLFWLN